ncbi:HlyD family efflux transporter periplasmic adaptor subunit [uncultured Chitinophaga sp.]|jgi:Membrane-fusion protein|uniref:efflux RND transporter periplasmic adaptor subunit n=1 Tax=uncultured Chitinophaga sp. TaxID=339340 RepID=UPI002622C0A1|nr:HlyD family efflux transporter periplasmic adaptor subunit [uncultured Chitinophaga sp.]
MDKVIETEVRLQRKKKLVWTLSLSLLLIIAVVIWLRAVLSPSLSQSEIITAVVERGDIENTINASGEVQPEFEEVITSPINASIREVMMEAGSSIKAGQPILLLDKTASANEYEKLQFQLESKRNYIKKLRLELEKSFYDIKSSNDVKQLRINSMEAEVENAKRLFRAGGGTREDIEQAALELEVARLEKQQLENEIRSKQQTMQIEMKEAAIAASIEESNLRELGRKLQLANIAASREGVITWVNRNIGESIHEGDPLARIADLRSFKVQGSIADQYLDQLRNGMPAIVKINDAAIRGTVVNIQPAVQNGIITFAIQLNEGDNKRLRPNMKVDVFLVTAAKKNALRVTNGAAFKGADQQDIFVVRNGKAERRKVRIGLSNFDYVELMDNVQPGEQVIISDMSAFKHARGLTINN